jgi:Histidine kinase-, DNA gyrase B-, and HSP90-like ATPase/Sugar-specific transcriptional regulator TrmB
MIYANRTERNEGDAGIGIKVAVYPKSGEPEVSEISAASPHAASAKFSKLVMEKIRDSGGRVPEEAVRELVENLIHAEFRGVVISILEDGNVVRISDKGPGIEHKQRAFEFGFSGATPEAVREIRGVGAGLGIARASAEKAGGTVTVEDNIGGGTVATVSMGETVKAAGGGHPSIQTMPQRKYPDAVPKMNISERQQKVLITVLECGEVGPSTVAERLEISVSTAYRDLSVLEEHGLVAGDESGKRVITPLGQDLVEAIVNAWVK